MPRRLMVHGYKAHELGIFSDDHPAIKHIKKAIENKLRFLHEHNGLEWVIIHGNSGTETWTAEVVRDLKKEYPNLKLSLMLPFTDFGENWGEANKARLERIKESADFTGFITDKPYESPEQLKTANQFMLRKTDGALFFYDEERETSVRFIYELAKKKHEHNNYELLTITGYDIQEIIEEELNNQYFESS